MSSTYLSETSISIKTFSKDSKNKTKKLTSNCVLLPLLKKYDLSSYTDLKNTTINSSWSNFPNQSNSFGKNIPINKKKKNKKLCLSSFKYNQIIKEFTNINKKIAQNSKKIEELSENLKNLKLKKKNYQLEIVDLLSNKESLEEIYKNKIYYLSIENNNNSNNENKKKPKKFFQLKNINDIPNNELIIEDENDFEIKIEEIKNININIYIKQVISLIEDILRKKINESKEITDIINKAYKIFTDETSNSVLFINEYSIISNFFMRISLFISNQSLGKYSESKINLFLRYLLKINNIEAKMNKILKFLNKTYKESKDNYKDQIKNIIKANEGLKNKKILLQNKIKNLKNNIKNTSKNKSDDKNTSSKIKEEKYENIKNEKNIKELNNFIENNTNNNYDNNNHINDNTVDKNIDNNNIVKENNRPVIYKKLCYSKKKIKSFKKQKKDLEMVNIESNKENKDNNKNYYINSYKYNEKFISNETQPSNNNKYHFHDILNSLHKTHIRDNNKNNNITSYYKKKINNSSHTNIFKNQNNNINSMNFSTGLQKSQSFNSKKITLHTNTKDNDNNDNLLKKKKKSLKILKIPTSSCHKNIYTNINTYNNFTYSANTFNNNTFISNNNFNLNAYPVVNNINKLNFSQIINNTGPSNNNIKNLNEQNSDEFSQMCLYAKYTKKIVEAFCYFKLGDINKNKFNPLENYKNRPEKFGYLEGCIIIDIMQTKIKIIKKNICDPKINNDDKDSNSYSDYSNDENNNEESLFIKFNKLIDIEIDEQMKNIIEIHNIFLKYNKNNDISKSNINQILYIKEINEIPMEQNEKIKAALCNYFSFIIIFKNNENIEEKIECLFINYEQYNMWLNSLKNIIKINKNKITKNDNNDVNNRKKNEYNSMVHVYKKKERNEGNNRYGK